jgi:hypothetical protein
MQQLNVYSTLPDLKDEVGHAFSYNVAVEKAVTLNGWQYKTLIPKNCSITNLPNTWIRKLNSTDWKKNSFLKKIWTTLSNFKTIFSFLKDINKTNSILFIEHFSLVDLLLLTICVFLLKPSFQIWILQRYASSQLKAHGKIHMLLYKIIKTRTKNKTFKLLTDSEILQKNISETFNMPTYLVPIPHGEIINHNLKDQNNKNILCWWPGGSIRPEKGSHIIKQFIKLIQKRPNITLIVAENFKTALSEEHNIILIPRNLSRENYENWMQKATFILLPYDPKVYHSGTSGIFVEAINAGAIPLCTDNTWMAYELKKFNLQELLFDWTNISALESLKNDKKMLEKLSLMRHYYQKFHNVKTFADTLASFLPK